MLHERCHTGPRKKKSIKFGPTLSAMYPHLINCLNCSIFFKWFKCISHSSVDTLKLNVIFTPILTYKHNIPFVFLSEIGPFFSRVTLSLTKSDTPRYYSNIIFRLSRHTQCSTYRKLYLLTHSFGMFILISINKGYILLQLREMFLESNKVILLQQNK